MVKFKIQISQHRHPPIANYIDICLPDICHIQDLIKILCSSPCHLCSITQYLTINILYHPIPCLLAFPHSLYLIPKHFFVTPEIIPQSFSPSPVRHSFWNLDCQFPNHSQCRVSAISNPISSLKPFLKGCSVLGHRPTHLFIHSAFFSARLAVSCHIHHCYTPLLYL